MTAASSVNHVAPAQQPTSVQQIAGRLFEAYTVDGGSVHLAGCLLEDRVFVRLDFRAGDLAAEIFLDDRGGEVDRPLVQALGMTETIRLSTPPELLGPEMGPLVQRGTRLFQERLPQHASAELVGATVLWCKFAEGKLRFTLGEQVADLPFAGWARDLRPPAFVCPHTGVSTYHLAATDDGRIVAAEQIDTCAASGRRVLAEELVACSVTGRVVLPEWIATCPVSSESVLDDAMVRCGTCRQRVSPAVLKRNDCAACRRLQRVSKADPRMARLLDEHPRLDRWRRWQISETDIDYILVASGWLKKLLVVADKDSLSLKLLATGTRLWSGFSVVEPSQYEYVLRE